MGIFDKKQKPDTTPIIRVKFLGLRTSAEPGILGSDLYTKYCFLIERESGCRELKEYKNSDKELAELLPLISMD